MFYMHGVFFTWLVHKFNDIIITVYMHMFFLIDDEKPKFDIGISPLYLISYPIYNVRTKS